MSEKKKNSLIQVAKTPTQKPNLLKTAEQNEEASVKAKQPKKAGRKPIPTSERETESNPSKDHQNSEKGYREPSRAYTVIRIY